MDVYSHGTQRAHDSGYMGIEADSDDAIDNLEVYEALINPREAQGAGAGGGSPMMMPPMMGGMGMGAGGGMGASAGMGAGQAMAASAAAGGAARFGTMAAAGAAPTANVSAAAAAPAAGGMPGGAMPSIGGMGGLGGMPSAAGAMSEAPEIVEAEAEEVVEEAPVAEAEDAPAPAPVTPDGTGQLVSGPAPDVIEVDPGQVERVAKEWSELSSEMADVSKVALELQASLQDFGLVKQPAGPYGEMASGIESLANGASKEFEEIATGLSYGAQSYRDQEAVAAQTVRSAQ